jgi:hypothetical protein
MENIRIVIVSSAAATPAVSKASSAKIKLVFVIIPSSPKPVGCVTVFTNRTPAGPVVKHGRHWFLKVFPGLNALARTVLAEPSKLSDLNAFVEIQIQRCVIPAQAGISSSTNCNNNDFVIPACAGMTEIKRILTFYERIKFYR